MKAKCVWFTGLPCSGKTTLATELKKYIPNCLHLDGDYMRGTVFGKNVSFTPEDRRNHLLRMGTIAKLAIDSGVTVLCSFVSPNEAVRQEVRELFDDGEFIEVHVSTPVEKCEERDVKGMYARARAGEIKYFTGLDGPYDQPSNPELNMDTSGMSIEESLEILIEKLDLYGERVSFAIGRWNGIYHNGHDFIIQEMLKKGRPVVMAIRDVKPDEKNPWTAVEVKEMLDYQFADDPRVSTIIIPDIASVEYGRDVGYEVNENKVTQKIAAISGTACRQMVAEGKDDWKELVPPRIVEFLQKRYDN